MNAECRTLAERVTDPSGTASSKTAAACKLLCIPDSYLDMQIVEQFVLWLENDHPISGVRFNAIEMISFALSLGSLDRRLKIYRRCAKQAIESLDDFSPAVRSKAISVLDGLTRHDLKLAIPKLRRMAKHDRGFSGELKISIALQSALAYAEFYPGINSKEKFIKCVESFGFKFDPRRNEFKDRI